MRCMNSRQQAETKTLDFIAEHPLAVLSTSSEKAVPHGAAIFAVVDEHFNFYFLTRSRTKKYANLQQKPIAALTFADRDQQITVQVEGTTAEVREATTIDMVFKKLARIRTPNDIDWLPPVAKLQHGNYIVIRLVAQSVRIADFKKFKSHDSTEYFTDILS